VNQVLPRPGAGGLASDVGHPDYFHTLARRAAAREVRSTTTRMSSAVQPNVPFSATPCGVGCRYFREGRSGLSVLKQTVNTATRARIKSPVLMPADFV